MKISQLARWWIGSGLCLALALSSCGKNKNEESPQNFVPVAITQIPLAAALSSGGCLNSTRYLEQLRSLDENLSMTVITKSIQFSSKKSIRSAYALLTAFGSFNFSTTRAGDWRQLPEKFLQADCETITLTEADGGAETFKVKEKSADHVLAQAESGRQIGLRWLSPTQVEVTRQTVAFDLPCGSELRPIFVTQVKVYDWGAPTPELIPLSSPIAVDRRYLEQIAEATNVSPENFYASNGVENSGPTEFQSATKLREIPSLTAREDLLTCPDAEPPPPPEEEEDSGDSTPED